MKTAEDTYRTSLVDSVRSIAAQNVERALEAQQGVASSLAHQINATAAALHRVDTSVMPPTHVLERSGVPATIPPREHEDFWAIPGTPYSVAGFNELVIIGDDGQITRRSAVELTARDAARGYPEHAGLMERLKELELDALAHSRGDGFEG